MMPRAWSWLPVFGCLVVVGCVPSSEGAGSGGSGGANEPSDSAGAAGSTDEEGSGGGSGETGTSGTGGSDGDGSAGSAGKASGGSAGKGSGGTAGKGSGGTAGKGSGGAAGKGSGGSAGNGSAGSAALPAGTLLFLRRASNDNDLLVSRSLATGKEQIITDLTGDGSSGWRIEGVSLSPDRQRIAIASLYDPTAADVATGLATRAIWTLAVDGSDFERLTPTFPNDAQGRKQYSLEVGGAEWAADGSQVVYDFGTFWWEGTNIQGGSFPWQVATSGGAVPSPFTTPTDCAQVIHPSRNPVTGEFLFTANICIPGQGEGAGLYLYPPSGTKAPKKLVASAHVDGNVDIYSGKPAWFPDGSGFLFMGGITESAWRPSLLLFDKASAKIFVVASAPVGTSINGAAVSPDGSKAVYCIRQDESGATDLRMIDLASPSLTDTAVTSDGKSCDPAFLAGSATRRRRRGCWACARRRCGAIAADVCADRPPLDSGGLCGEVLAQRPADA